MKNKILTILMEHENNYISGEKIAEMLNVSRVAISKHIKKLREEGYDITSTSHKGYLFVNSNDTLRKDQILSHLHPFYQEIEILDEVTSTNDYIKENYDRFQEGQVVIANLQKKGKGRNGRSFISPAHKGIYMSFLLKPSISIYDSLKLTACASVAIFDAIKICYNLDSGIKWVNDIYLNDKKVAGILCEASLEMNTASLEYMIVGIGINVHSYQKENEIKDIAGSIEDYTDVKVSRNKIIQEILNHFYKYYEHIEENTFLTTYKEHSCILNKEVLVSRNNESYPATCIDIDEHANLIVENEKKERVVLNSGEVSIRKKH